MKIRFANFMLAGIGIAGAVLLVCGAAIPAARTANSAAASQPANLTPPASLTIDYPLDGSIFPPEITPPTFLWHDASEQAKRWVVQVSFAGLSDRIRVEARGEFMQVGENDPDAGLPAQLTPEQASTHTWRPDDETWEKIKRLSVKSPATIVISGFAEGGSNQPVPPQPVSTGKVTISTSKDPVGAPVFYRNVPLIVSPVEQKGPITPLPPSAIPLIKWELRNIGEPKSSVVMENLPTCANCHSFSMDGKTLGIDLDGPRNDKGLYAIVNIVKNSTIHGQDVIRWSSFKEHPDVITDQPEVKRFGFMSQVSPNGRYVVSSIGPPELKNTHQDKEPDFAPGAINRVFSVNYKDLNFIQVFYPTRGILAYYDRVEKKMRTLPGADDPQYVHTSAFWSPDGKYLIYSRAVACDPFPPGVPKPTHANDPNETQIKYDLYKIPFNDGQGGKAVPMAGASQNGMSNDFPKVSPDGRWIVFVENKNGLLMRPDSNLYIMPAAGGKPRLMKCNTWRMNSWHSFSPNGRWLAFSSKARSAYTQLMLTHIDANGNDSPAIIVDNTTAANRAINIPEFLNIPQGGLEKIDPQAAEFYRYFNKAYALLEDNHFPEAIDGLRQALEKDPDDPVAHFALATALTGNNQEDLALVEYRKACELNTKNPLWFDHLATSLVLNNLPDEAVENWRKALALDATDAEAESNIGMTLFENGNTQDGYDYLRKAADMAPDFPDAHNHLGLALAKLERLDEAVAEFQKAIALDANSAEYRFNLGFTLELKGDFAGAIAPLQKSVELSGGKDWTPLAQLAAAYGKTGHSAEAIQCERQALDAAVQQHDDQAAANLRQVLDHYQREGAAPQQR